jgi:aspartate ammonia-lyase
VHPNDHVNMGQSTNDVFPTATRVALLMTTPGLVDAARALALTLDRKASEFADVLKVGRTHLQDAVPITLGQEFSGWAGCVVRGAEDVEQAARQLLELNLGATALGTGLNAGDDYTNAAIANLARYTSVPVVPAANRFRVTQSMGDVVAWSGAVRRLAIEVGKLASDLRLLSMGPRAGLAEIALPAVQPGSSIMPGKVNPSIPEMVNQVCFQVLGCDTTISAAAEAGQLELNVMMPVIAFNVLLSMQILTNATNVLADRCVKGIEANREMCQYWVERSAALATALAPQIGYAKAAEISKRSVKEGVLIRDLVKREHVLPDDQLDDVLDLKKMTEIGVPGGAHGVSAGG